MRSIITNFLSHASHLTRMLVGRSQAKREREILCLVDDLYHPNATIQEMSEHSFMRQRKSTQIAAAETAKRLQKKLVENGAVPKAISKHDSEILKQIDMVDFKFMQETQKELQPKIPSQ